MAKSEILLDLVGHGRRLDLKMKFEFVYKNLQEGIDVTNYYLMCKTKYMRLMISARASKGWHYPETCRLGVQCIFIVTSTITSMNQ
mgnify:CR=1 FL=1